MAGKVTDSQFRYAADNWTLEQPLSLTASLSPDITLGPQCWASEEARLCLEPARIFKGTVDLGYQLEQFDMQKLAHFYPEGFGWQALLSARGKMQWQDGQPKVSMQLKTSPGSSLLASCPLIMTSWRCRQKLIRTN